MQGIERKYYSGIATLFHQSDKNLSVSLRLAVLADLATDSNIALLKINATHLG
jgi:hypothetical protein